MQRHSILSFKILGLEHRCYSLALSRSHRKAVTASATHCEHFAQAHTPTAYSRIVRCCQRLFATRFHLCMRCASVSGMGVKSSSQCECTLNIIANLPCIAYVIAASNYSVILNNNDCVEKNNKSHEEQYGISHHYYIISILKCMKWQNGTGLTVAGCSLFSMNV